MNLRVKRQKRSVGPGPGSYELINGIGKTGIKWSICSKISICGITNRETTH